MKLERIGMLAGMNVRLYQRPKNLHLIKLLIMYVEKWQIPETKKPTTFYSVGFPCILVWSVT